MSIKSIFWCARDLLILATDGTLYKGTITRRTIQTTNQRGDDEDFVEQKSNRKMDISANCKCDIDLMRIPSIDRVTNVSVDQRGESFVVLQENSKRYLLVPSVPDEQITFKALLNETTEFDLLHDIIFHVSDDDDKFGEFSQNKLLGSFPKIKFLFWEKSMELSKISKKIQNIC